MSSKICISMVLLTHCSARKRTTSLQKDIRSPKVSFIHRCSYFHQICKQVTFPSLLFATLQRLPIPIRDIPMGRLWEETWESIQACQWARTKSHVATTLHGQFCTLVWAAACSLYTDSVLHRMVRELRLECCLHSTELNCKVLFV